MICEWLTCLFTPAWQIEAPGPGQPTRFACTTHLGFVCVKGSPDKPLRVTLMRAHSHVVSQPEPTPIVKRLPVTTRED